MNGKDLLILAAAGFGLWYMLTKSASAQAAQAQAASAASANTFTFGDPAFNPNANFQAPFVTPPVAPQTNNPLYLTNGQPTSTLTTWV